MIALDQVTFQVPAGKICAVVGPNGAGKSTLFRVLTGLTSPSSGRATILGVDIAKAPVSVRRSIGFMSSEDRALWMRQTCWENLWFHGRLQGMGGKQLDRRIKQTLEMVGLGHAVHRVAFALSAGMNARLRLGRALLHRPEVLIIDEPTGTLDPVSSFRMVETIQQVAASEGMAVLMSSHKLEDIEALGDNVLMLSAGRVLYWGDLTSLRAMWEKPRVEMRFRSDEEAAVAAESLNKIEGVEGVSLEPPAVCIATSLGIGQLLSRFNGSTAGLEEVHRSQMPLRELLATLLASDTATGVGAEGDAG